MKKRGKTSERMSAIKENKNKKRTYKNNVDSKIEQVNKKTD